MQEVRHDNIKVSYIMPGSVNTGLVAVRQAMKELAIDS
jgi:short-subunit dehydrogenase